ncbi:HTH_Tnp_Tc3_2 domain-containing protein [Trichonephila clavipes]|uniref:HTH_Tnp_Tc3_2 domain-containing protein n=1 Tax=Trichonephila clavipes TaxID=2585209 RepID=A0A8X7BMF1_TRICX|nr:HTH_Tnp_Tc3_2 domain-containing protein [Trichonephila clavipes]
MASYCEIRGRVKIEVEKWLNLSPSVIHRLWLLILTMDLAPRRFSQGCLRTTTRADSSCTRRNRAATPAELRYSLAASSGGLLSRLTVHRRFHERSL